MNCRPMLLAAVLLAGAFNSGPSWGVEPTHGDGAEQFIRLRRGGDGQPLTLESALVRYSSAARPGVTVDLIGAVHIAEGEYYTDLNRRFREYDAVLYELVAPPDAVQPEPGQRSSNPISALQVGMKNLLGLAFQLDAIDYRRPNLVHADLSPAEFATSMAQRGESVVQMMFRLIGQSIAMQAREPAKGTDLQLLAALVAPDRQLKLKRVLAEQFADLSTAAAVLEGPKGSTIITVRNRRALDVLARQLEMGSRKLAIFYGAAHLPDMDRQLRERFGLAPSQRSWLAAWQLEAKVERE